MKQFEVYNKLKWYSLLTFDVGLISYHFFFQEYRLRSVRLYKSKRSLLSQLFALFNWSFNVLILRFYFIFFSNRNITIKVRQQLINFVLKDRNQRQNFHLLSCYSRSMFFISSGVLLKFFNLPKLMKKKSPFIPILSNFVSKLLYMIHQSGYVSILTFNGSISWLHSFFKFFTLYSPIPLSFMYIYFKGFNNKNLFFLKKFGRLKRKIQRKVFSF